MSDARNILGGALQVCSQSPMTGFARDGLCHSGPHDLGSHTVCVQVTDAFLEYSQSRGNDLTTPIPEQGFPGLKAGDRWCVCAMRWLEAADDGMAPPVILDATHERALRKVSLGDLKYHALVDADTSGRASPRA